MLKINHPAVFVAAIAAFVLSTIWYIGFAKQRTELSAAAVAEVRKPQPVKMVLEIVRNIILAYILAYLVTRLGITTWLAAMTFTLLLWIGFPVLLLTGSVMWENVPWKLAAIHGGDWLLKLLAVIVILSRWR
jgi:hypothetical protein